MNLRNEPALPWILSIHIHRNVIALTLYRLAAAALFQGIALTFVFEIHIDPPWKRRSRVQRVVSPDPPDHAANLDSVLDDLLIQTGLSAIIKFRSCDDGGCQQNDTQESDYRCIRKELPLPFSPNRGRAPHKAKTNWNESFRICSDLHQEPHRPRSNPDLSPAPPSSSDPHTRQSTSEAAPDSSVSATAAADRPSRRTRRRRSRCSA